MTAAMPNRFLTVCICSIIWAAGVTSSDLCPDLDCECTSAKPGQLDVSCSKSRQPFRDLVSRLPSQTKHFRYTVPPSSSWQVVDVGAANFSHLASLETLHLIDNTPYIDCEPLASLNIKTPEQKVFWPLKNLQELKINITWFLSNELPELLSQCENFKVLDLSDSRELALIFLRNLLRGLRNRKSFQVLNLRNTHALRSRYLLPLHVILNGLENCTLAELDISQNGISKLTQGLVMYAPVLKIFNASNNRISLDKGTLFDLILHPTLIEVDFSGQLHKLDTENRANTQLSYTNKTTFMEEDVQLLRRIPTPFRHSNCSRLLLDDFCNIYSPPCASVLQGITQQKSFWCDVFSHVFSLDLIPCDTIPPASSLLHPHCAGCMVIPLVGNIRKLHLQNVRSNALLVQLLHQDTCFHASNQLEFLNLANNRLQNFTLNLQNFSKLSTINLSGNKIHSLSVNTTNQLSANALQLHNTTLKINLSNNLLHCSCSNPEFVNWMVSKPRNIQFINFEKYRCLDDKLRRVLFHNLSGFGAFDCLGKDVYIVLGICSGILMSVIMAALGIWIYRKRWWIRYNYFLARQMWSRSKRQAEQNREYQWDVFVCYQRQDREWVTGTLQPKLEDEHGIKLCLHERDFELGHHITDLVIESIENSRKTLLILSPNFVQSSWCMFELRMAHQKLFMTGQEVLMLAMLRPLGDIEDKTLKALLEQRNYLEWSDDEYGRKLFWARLLVALGVHSTRTTRKVVVRAEPIPGSFSEHQDIPLTQPSPEISSEDQDIPLIQPSLDTTSEYQDISLMQPSPEISEYEDVPLIHASINRADYGTR